jgi:sorting nexin-8
MPPKQIMLDSFLEGRRTGLQRWLRLLSRHPVIAHDEILKAFLTSPLNENSKHLQSVFDRDPEEFIRCPLNTKLLLGSMEDMIATRERMRSRVSQVVKLKILVEQQATREVRQSLDFEQMAMAMDSLSTNTNYNFKDFSESFQEISKESEKVSANQQLAVMERLSMVVDVLTGFGDLCERIEKNHSSDLRKRRDSLISEMEVGRRKAFSLFCNIEETKFAENYVKLLPSILLQFSHEEAKGFTNISEIFTQIVQKESDKIK